MDGAPRFGLGYTRARALLLAVGLAILLVVAGVMYARRVETVEVVATLLFIPVFIAFVFWRIPGGLVAAVLATLAYVALRNPAIEAVGLGRFGGQIAGRAVGFLLFGVIGGWASRLLETSLTKLELYDQIDDATGLFNARFFAEDLELEVSRSKRYQTIFSVVVLDVPASVFETLSRRQRSRLLRELGRLLRNSIRAVDRASHASDGARHSIAVILPETAAEGREVFAGRLVDRVCEYLTQRGAPVTPDRLGLVTATFPEDEATVVGLRTEFEALDRMEHPEAAATSAAREAAERPPAEA